MLNDKKAHEKAKNEDELFLVEALKSGEGVKLYRNACQIKDDNADIDIDFHTDVLVKKIFPDGNYEMRHMDAKSAKSDTGNFSLGEKCIENIRKERGNSYDFAFRLWENGVETTKYLIVNAKDAIDSCRLREMHDRNDSVYYLISVNEIRSKCKYLELEPDLLLNI